MVRIIPWNLPPVNGGSVGGYTPAPTPPTPSNYPYDLDNIQLSTDFDSFHVLLGGSTPTTYIYGKLSVSGVGIIDTTSVSSVIATVHATPGTDVWTNGEYMTANLEEADIDVEIGQIMTSMGGEAIVGNYTRNGKSCLYNWLAYSNNSSYPTLTSTTATLTVTKITVYNANGVALQEWTPGE